MAVLSLRPRPAVRRWLPAVVIAAWLACWPLLNGRDTLPLAGSDLTSLHRWINARWDTIDNSRSGNPFFHYFIGAIRTGLDAAVTFAQALISQPSFGRPVPVLGWLGVVAVATAIAFLYANLRMALLTAASFVAFGVLGLWQQSMDTLSITLVAVTCSLAIGIPLGIWAGVSDRFDRVVTPVLDIMQTMPTFVYLAPLTLFFLIGPASATIATMIYAIPPCIRLTSHGIREVSPATLEASTSLGATEWQSLRKVRLPLAKQAMVVGINQTMMAALSMVTIAALIDSPGLGQTVYQTLQKMDIGTAFNGGLALVIMAIMLDRVTSAASRRVERTRRAGRLRSSAYRRWKRPAALTVAAVLCYLSYTYVWAAVFPTLGDTSSYVPRAAAATSAWVQNHLAGFTGALKNLLTYGMLNPFESLLTGTPWWLALVVAVSVAALLVGFRTAAIVAVGLVLLVVLGLWQDSMVTLASTLVATFLVMVLGLFFGVWMGRSDRVDTLLRPLLDAGQTMPAFVYLVPVLGLFGATRFTAIIAAVAYAAPASIKLVAEGIRAVAPAAVEAATSAGSTVGQLIFKVQLPMARRAVTLATSQGLIYVLAMVVVGGMVGAGALGYDVVAGFSQTALRGKGLAAGVSIVVLGLMLDRVMRAVAHRVELAAHGPADRGADGGH
ncbi:MAG: transporter permease [Actinomycetia bacterium]|nr:transporter permease [Actinomycetes bacterium]